MNNALAILMSVTFFAPVGLMVLLNLYLYREARYVSHPPAPMLPAPVTAAPVAAEVVNDFDFREAA